MAKKISKSNANEPSNIVITDAIKIKALQSEVNYWKIKYILLDRYETET